MINECNCIVKPFAAEPEACRRIAKTLEPFNLLWLEIDVYDPEAILKIRESTTTPICTGENLFHMRGYIPYFERQAADVFMVDVPWKDEPVTLPPRIVDGRMAVPEGPGRGADVVEEALLAHP